MSLSRNARRVMAKQRREAKLARLAKAELGRQADERTKIVRSPMNSRLDRLGNVMHNGRNYYPRSCLAGIEAMSHRGYVCRPSGGKARR